MSRTAKAKTKHPQQLIHGHVCEFGRVSLDALEPARLNDQIYKPVDRKDPTVRDLATDIRQNGLLQPFLITLDHVILAGHRRRVACQIIGLKEVPVYIYPILSTDEEFPRVLVAANNQRIKTAEEITREEIVRYNPTETHRRLLEHRKQSSAVDLTDAIQIEGEKRRSKISEAKRPMLDAVIEVLHNYREFLPITLRRIHYALLNHPPLRYTGKAEQVFYRGKWRSNRYCNDLDSYKDLSNLLTRERHEGIVAWSWIHDPTRPDTSWDTQPNIQGFILEQMEKFLADYHRDYLQSQPNLIVMIGEKMTLDGVIRPVVAEYGIRVMTGRGYSSYTKMKELAERFRKSGKEKLIPLFVSDYDPEGVDIPHAFARCLRDDHGIAEGKIVPKRIALTDKQVQMLMKEKKLHPQMKVKESSSRSKKFKERYGEDVFEVEAVPPRDLQTILRNAINSVLDVAAFNAEIDREAEDSAYLESLQYHMNYAMEQVMLRRKRENGG
jgi:hypothetical protein